MAAAVLPVMRVTPQAAESFNALSLREQAEDTGEQSGHELSISGKAVLLQQQPKQFNVDVVVPVQETKGSLDASW